MPQSDRDAGEVAGEGVAHGVDDVPDRHEVAGPLQPGRRRASSAAGSRESSSTGIITMLMTGAITSSLLVVSARALDAAAQAPPTQQGEQDAEHDPAERSRASP